MTEINEYQPPFTITPGIVTLVARIGEALGQLSAMTGDALALRLRRINRVRTIRGSLAIEGNTLSEAQITAMLDGKRIVAPPREIQEVRNAIAVYDRLMQWKPHSESDLLAAHGMLMADLMDDAGAYRRKGAGVMGGGRVIHMAPPANRIPILMADLFRWLSVSEHHPLITSSVFHYEFEFIHPFTDGNGRMGRLWQTLLLAHWEPVFSGIPVENLVFEHQADYYEAIQSSTDQTDAAPFIEFMLRMILDAISATLLTDQASDYVSDQVARLLDAIGNREMSASDLLKALNLSHRPTLRKNYINPALSDGWIERTQPNAPRSPTQRYRLTAKGFNYKNAP